jgi:hypothetical protein
MVTFGNFLEAKKSKYPISEHVQTIQLYTFGPFVMFEYGTTVDIFGWTQSTFEKYPKGSDMNEFDGQ